MKSMLLYLEAARVKLDIALADIEGRPKPVCPLVQYMRHQRDKQGLPQTILKVCRRVLLSWNLIRFANLYVVMLGRRYHHGLGMIV